MRSCSIGVWLLTTLFTFAVPNAVQAGGGPANVLVVFNADDAESTRIAQYYATARAVPSPHRCGLSLGRDRRMWVELADYLTRIAAPVERCWRSVPQPELIDYVVLVRGVPPAVRWHGRPEGLEPRSWQDAAIRLARAARDLVRDPSAEVERFYPTSALLQVHGVERIDDSVPLVGLPPAIGPWGPISRNENPQLLFSENYDTDVSDEVFDHPASPEFTAASAIVRAEALPRAFRRRGQATRFGEYDFTDRLRIVTYLDGFTADDTLRLIDRSVEADGSFPATPHGQAPEATFLCMAGEAHSIRRARDPECEIAVRHLARAGFRAEFSSTLEERLQGRTLVALFTGVENLRNGIAGNEFVPGAIASNMTSFGAFHNNLVCNSGGQCPGEERQTSILRFTQAGATGADGTSDEPMATALPRAGAMLLYASGYNVGESFFFTQPYVYWMNHLVADPLTTPFAERPEVCSSIEADRIQAGQELRFAAAHPSGIATMQAFDRGRLVAEADADHLSFELDEYDAGDEVELLVVATAHNWFVERPGWPVARQLVQPDVQGWSSQTVRVTSEATARSELSCRAARNPTGPESMIWEFPGQPYSTFPGWNVAGAWLGAGAFGVVGLWSWFRRRRLRPAPS